MADAIHHVFHSLQLDQEPLAGEPLTPQHSTADTQDTTPNSLSSYHVVPTVLVSAPEEDGEGPGKEGEEPGDGAGKGDTETELCTSLGLCVSICVDEVPPTPQPQHWWTAVSHSMKQTLAMLLKRSLPPSQWTLG